MLQTWFNLLTCFWRFKVTHRFLVTLGNELGFYKRVVVSTRRNKTLIEHWLICKISIVFWGLKRVLRQSSDKIRIVTIANFCSSRQKGRKGINATFGLFSGKKCATTTIAASFFQMDTRLSVRTHCPSAKQWKDYSFQLFWNG